MLAFLKPYWLSIVKWAGIIGGVLLLFFKIRQSGRDAERVDNLERNIENVERAKKIRRGVADSGDSVNKLRERWSRDR
jgi:uncharacterized membrane protein YdjX (TVP38/TMEM64 family)